MKTCLACMNLVGVTVLRGKGKNLKPVLVGLICIYVHIYTHTHTYIIYKHMHTYIHRYIHTHIHTYTHIISLDNSNRAYVITIIKVL